MKSFQYDGVWWNSEQPDRRWFGTLQFNRRDGAWLALIVQPEKGELFPKLESHDLILGQASSGTLISLIRCHERSKEGSWFGIPRRVEIYANAVIVGLHCQSVDPLLSTVSVSFLHANEWRAQSGVECDPTVKPPDFAARYRASVPVLLHENESFRVTLRSTLKASAKDYKSSMHEGIRFEVHALAPATTLGVPAHYKRMRGFPLDRLSYVLWGEEYFPSSAKRRRLEKADRQAVRRVDL